MQKKYLYLSILLFAISFASFCQAKEPSRKFNIAISLGMVCQPAGNLYHNGLRFHSFPLDWWITPFDGLINFLTYEGKDFLLPQNLLFNVAAYGNGALGVLDTRYGIYLYHDFEYTLKDNSPGVKKYNEVVVKNYPEVKEKFNRRIKRFFDVLRSNKKVFFVRLGITYKQAVFLDTFLQTKFPHLDYLILAVDDTQEMKFDWGLKRVKNFYIERQSMYGSRPEDWTKIFKQFEFEIDKTQK